MFIITFYLKSSTLEEKKMNYFFVLFVVTIASINAAPAPAKVASDSDVADLKAALQPVQQELRAMYDNAEFAVKDLAELAIKSANDLSASAKQIMSPADRSLSRNILEEAKSLASEAQDLGRDLISRAIDDYQPLISNERRAILTGQDAVRMIANKYLTRDGQDLIQSLTGAAKRMIP